VAREYLNIKELLADEFPKKTAKIQVDSGRATQQPEEKEKPKPVVKETKEEKE
jgi:hypothetical protein